MIQEAQWAQPEFWICQVVKVNRRRAHRGYQQEVNVKPDRGGKVGSGGE